MIGELREMGAIRTDGVAEVFRAVPRHLEQTLTALAARPVPDHEPVNTVDYVMNNTGAHFDVEIDRAVLDQVTWTTAHNDLHWGNVTGPELCVLDWESWARAPAGHDAGILLCASLQHSPTATRIREICQPVLDNHSAASPSSAQSADTSLFRTNPRNHCANSAPTRSPNSVST
ncbi:MAG: hypothetical protein ACRDTE_14450 [Pseudonocardiaceae bacterium]